MSFIRSNLMMAPPSLSSCKLSSAQQYSPKAHRKKLDEFTDGRTGIPSLDITNDASSTAHAGAQGKGKKSKNSSSASQQPQRSGKSLFDPQPSQQKDATRVAVGKKEQSGAKSSGEY